MVKGDDLAGIEFVGLHENIPAYGGGAPVFYFAELRGKSMHKKLEPCAEIHVLAAHALKGLIESGAIAVVVSAEGEEAFEVVARAIEAEGGEEARAASISINEGVDVDELELGNAGDEDGMDGGFFSKPGDELVHEGWDIFGGWRSIFL